jgi:predicted transcriptional regulator
MAPNPISGDSGVPTETEDDRKRRIAWDAKMIAEADTQIEAGPFVGSDEIDAWTDSIGTDHELPPPPTRRR